MIQQETNYYCGPASALQVIEYFGTENYITGNGGTLQQKLYNNMVNNDNVSPDSISIELNKSYYESPYPYYRYNNSVILDFNSFKSTIIQSINYKCPVIINAYTNYLGYYHNMAYGHYICLIGYDSINNIFIVRDCNCVSDIEDVDNDNDTEEHIFFGEFTVTMSDVYNASTGNTYNSKYIVTKVISN